MKKLWVIIRRRMEMFYDGKKFPKRPKCDKCQQPLDIDAVVSWATTLKQAQKLRQHYENHGSTYYHYWYHELRKK